MWTTHGGQSLGTQDSPIGVLLAQTCSTKHENFVRKCERCQKHASIVRQPPEMLTSINSPIPFVMWGMDILGPFPIASGQRKFLVVAIDYFTRWIEAKPLAKITTKQIAHFFWESIICRYGIPRFLVTDNGTQFNNAEFRSYYDENDIGLTLHLSCPSTIQWKGRGSKLNHPRWFKEKGRTLQKYLGRRTTFNTLGV